MKNKLTNTGFRRRLPIMGKEGQKHGKQFEVVS